MASTLKRARQALARGSVDEALVLLWNEVEAARLAGDEGALQAIERLAAQVASHGDEAQRREAERLLETVRGAPAADEAEFEVGTAGEAAGVPEEEREAAEVAPERAGRIPIGTIVWIVVVLGVLLLNLLGDRQ